MKKSVVGLLIVLILLLFMLCACKNQNENIVDNKKDNAEIKNKKDDKKNSDTNVISNSDDNNVNVISKKDNKKVDNGVKKEKDVVDNIIYVTKIAENSENVAENVDNNKINKDDSKNENKNIISYKSDTNLQEDKKEDTKTLVNNLKYDNTNVLYAWNNDLVLDNKVNNLYRMCDELNIKSIYFFFKKENFYEYKDQTRKMIERLSSKNISVFALDGDSSWFKSDREFNSHIFSWVVNYNNSVNDSSKIKGFVLDIEPAGTDEWKKDKLSTLRKYVDTQKIMYSNIKANNLLLIECIPVWFDNTSVDLLDELIKDASDGISIMNYNKKNMIKGIENEIAIAKKYNKQVDSVSEFMPVDGSVTENITFYNEGIESAKNRYSEVRNAYNYEKLGMGYHYYGPLAKLLNIE